MSLQIHNVPRSTYLRASKFSKQYMPFAKSNKYNATSKSQFLLLEIALGTTKPSSQLYRCNTSNSPSLDN